MATLRPIPKWQSDVMELSDLVTKYLTDPRYLNSQSSRDTYDHCLRQYIGYLASENLENSVRNFTPDTVEGFVGYLFKLDRKSSTINLRLSALWGLGQYARQTKYRGKYILDENPVDRVKRPKVNRPPIRHLSLDELKALLGVAHVPSERLALALVIDQPLRASEWCDANVKDLVLAGDQVALTIQVKGGEFRTKILGDKVSEALQASLREREALADSPLLVNTKGDRYTRQALSCMISRLALKAGITRIAVGAHVIRHSVASISAAMGSSVHELAEMLNHSGPQTVKRYVHGIKPDAALERIREALSSMSPQTLPPGAPDGCPGHEYYL
jgi:site-specific recombinase XerD